MRRPSFTLAAAATALALAGCASGPRNPLHVSFEELGYAGQDFGSMFGSVKYRSVVNIAGLAPISSVGGLHNRPSIYSRYNPQRLFREESLPDYYSLGLTTECSKIFEAIFDDGVTDDDVWEVRLQLQGLVGKARQAIAQLSRKRTVTALAEAYGQNAAALQALDAAAFGASTPPAEVARESALRTLLLQQLDEAGAGLSSLGLSAQDNQALAGSPTADSAGDWRRAVMASAAAFSRQAAATTALNPAQVEDAISKVSDQAGIALRKGIIVTRWQAESTRTVQGGLGTIVKGDGSETKGRQGFLVMGGIRLSQLMVGDDFITYHRKIRTDQTSGIDRAVREQFLVIYTIGARYRSFFEESANEVNRSLKLSLTAEQLGQVLDLPLKRSIGNTLDLIRSQSLDYQRQLQAAVEAAEQGFLPPPTVNIYEFRFNSDKLFEHSMMAEKARSAAYLPVYSVRADIVQKETRLLSGGDVEARSRCADANDAKGGDDRFQWKATSADTPQGLAKLGEGIWVRDATGDKAADHVQFHTPVFAQRPSGSSRTSTASARREGER